MSTLAEQIKDEDKREELVYQLLDEFRDSIGSAFNDEKKFSFIAGARAALVTISQS